MAEEHQESVDQTTGDKATSDQTTGQPPGTPDKALQKLQMKQASNERFVQKIASDIESLKQAIESSKASGDGSSSPPVSQQTQDFLGSLSDDETVNAKTLRQALSGFSGSVVESIKSELSGLTDELRQENRSSRVKSYWDNWTREHPTVADQRDDLALQAELEVDSRYPDLNDEGRFSAIQVVFDRLTDQAEQEAEGKGSKSKGSKPKGSKSSSTGDSTASTEPPESTEGTKITPEGGSSGSATGKKELPEPGPLWVQDGNNSDV